MLTPESATALVLKNASDFGTEIVPLSDSIGRVLAEPLIADRDFPPFDRVTMDGIAIDFEAFAKGQRDFPIAGLQAAGTTQLTLQETTQCIEVMTGAMLPQGADTVIRYEDVILESGRAKVQIHEVKQGQNLHLKGSDRKQADHIVLPNRIISAAEIGVAATVGKAQLLVQKLPRVIVISTGDELVSVEETPLEHQIRSSNVFVLQSLMSKWKIKAEQMHLPDIKEVVVAQLKHCLENFDLLMLSGGVSEGKLDYVPEALAALGVAKIFHKVQQRPGKPLWFGKATGGATVFALPGNPVSAFLGAVRYVKPWLRHSMRLSVEPTFAMLAEEVVFKPDLTYFLQVQVSINGKGQMLAKPVAGGGSGDLANLAEADGFLELPMGKVVYEKGEVFSFWRYR